MLLETALMDWQTDSHSAKLKHPPSERNSWWPLGYCIKKGNVVLNLPFLTGRSVKTLLKEHAYTSLNTSAWHGKVKWHESFQFWPIPTCKTFFSPLSQNYIVTSHPDPRLQISAAESGGQATQSNHVGLLNTGNLKPGGLAADTFIISVQAKGYKLSETR